MKRILFSFIIAILLVTTLQGALWTEDFDINLIAHYEMEDLTDSSGNIDLLGGDDSIPDHTPIFNSTDCFIGDCAHLDGIAQSFQLNNSDGLFNSSNYDGNLTWAGWFRPNSFSGSPQFFYQDGFIDMTITEATGVVNLQTMGDGTINTAGAVSLNDWNFVVVSRNTTNLCIWLNNTFQSCIANAITYGNSSSHIGFGSSYPDGAGNHNFSGELDQWSFWNRALTPAEINDLWNNGLGLKYKSGEITLNSPSDNLETVENRITFNCSINDEDKPVNISLYLDGAMNHTVFNESDDDNLSLQIALNISNSLHNWSCFSRDVNNQETRSGNRTLESGLNWVENSKTFISSIEEGSLGEFELNITLNPALELSSTSFIYNNTAYATTTNAYAGNNYSLYSEIVIPNADANTNMTFYWNVTLTNGSVLTSTLDNQTIMNFQIGNCSSYSVLLLNYTLYDEITQSVIGDNDNMTTEVEVIFYTSDLSRVFINFSLNSSSNNTQVCIGENLTTEASYYIDVTTRYDGGENYISKYNHIQKYLLQNSTIPINVPLYNLLITDSQEFLVTFKDSDFIRKGDVLVDVTRKYLPEGTFKSVEVAKTNTNGEALIHLVLGDIIYSLVFTHNGEVLAVLDNFLAYCENVGTGDCTINVNAFASTIAVEDFTYREGINYNINFNKTLRTITVVFSTQSGTRTVSLNATRYDRFGNNTICSDALTSSSGTLSCVIPESFGNLTIVSELYSNNVLVSRDYFTIRHDTSTIYGGASIYILALLIIITISMLFITDLRGILFATGLGIVVLVALGLLEGGNLFTVGTSLTWGFIVIAIVLYKISKRGKTK
jgi:hypothetical protein